MRKLLVCGMVFGLAVAAFAVISERGRTEAADEGGKMLLAHNVYFALKDNSAESKQKLVAACKKYLSNHPGEVFFAAGTLAEDLSRPVNDRDFDVALHIVFKDKEAHDKYQDADKHKQFIEENKDNWKKVRVFDSVVSK
jgi:heme-degrading monooxygenase HmoA